MISYEKTISLVPFLIVALAITFDVGYFWAIDINFFTLFSLSEHLVFAAEEIPLVIAVSIFVLFATALLTWLVAMKVDSAQKPQSKKRKWLLYFGWYAYLIFAPLFCFGVNPTRLEC